MDKKLLLVVSYLFVEVLVYVMMVILIVVILEWFDIVGIIVMNIFIILDGFVLLFVEFGVGIFWDEEVILRIMG